MIDYTICRDKGGRIIWEESQINYIINEYKNGIKTSVIAKQFNLSNLPIRALLKRNNIHVLSNTERAKIDFPRNSNFFSKVNSPIVAYWLGFLYADGCISNGSLEIMVKGNDKNHLEKFQKDLGAINHKLSKRTKINQSTKKEYIMYNFSIRDSKLINDLKKLGCIERKSLILTFPTEEQVPQLYIYDFIRGYFDGDGTISFDRRNKVPQCRFGFVGTKEFLTKLKDILKLTNTLQHFSNNQSYNFIVSGNKKSLEFFKQIYNNPNRFLQRKYDLYQEFIFTARELVNL